jgi:hypothetical protein
MATLRDEEGGEVNRARHAPSEQRRLAPDCYIPPYAHGDDSFLAQLACRETSRLKGVLHFMAEGNSAEGPDGRSEDGRRRMKQRPDQRADSGPTKRPDIEKARHPASQGTCFSVNHYTNQYTKRAPAVKLRESHDHVTQVGISFGSEGALVSLGRSRGPGRCVAVPHPSSRGVQKKLVVRSGGVGETAVTVGRPP